MVIGRCRLPSAKWPTIVLSCLLIFASAGCRCDSEPPDPEPPPTPPIIQKLMTTTIMAKRSAGYAAVWGGALLSESALVQPEWYEVVAEDWPDTRTFAIYSKPDMQLERPVSEYSAVVLHARSAEAFTLEGCPEGMWRFMRDTSGRALLLNDYPENPDKWHGEPGSLEIEIRDRILIRSGDLLFGDSDRRDALAELTGIFRKIDVPLFRIGRLEITNAQYAAFLNEIANGKVENYYNLLHPSAKIVLSEGRYVPLAGCEAYPVTAVYWPGADAFCKAVGGRLPSDVEWEIAGRGHQARLFPWGDDFDASKVNIYGSDDGFYWLAPADSMLQGAGPFGTLHQSGNVFEWMDRPEAEGPPKDEDSANLRGGGWNTLENSVQLMHKDNNYVTAANEHNGLRCVWPLHTPWGDRPFEPPPLPEPAPPVKVIPPEVRKLGAAVVISRKAGHYTAIWLGAQSAGPTLVEPDWLNEARGCLPEADPIALFSRSRTELKRPVVDYGSAVLHVNSAEGLVLRAGPAGMWTASTKYSGRSLLLNAFNRNPSRWLGRPGKVEVREEDRITVSSGLLVNPATGKLPDYLADLDVPLAEKDVPLFKIGRLEISNGQYAAFLNGIGDSDKVSEYYDLNHPSAKIVYHRGRYYPLKGTEDYPVTAVYWSGADAFCRETGGVLPADMEWEISARGGDGRRFPWGDAFDGERVNLYGAADGYPWLAPVDSMRAGAGPFGTLHQSGNAFEWMGRPEGPPDDPADAANLRGGAWNTLEHTVAAGEVDNNFVLAANEHNGFRCCWPIQTPWGERPLLGDPADEPGPPPRVITTEEVKLGGAMPLLRRAAAYVRMFGLMLDRGPALIDPDWYPEFEGQYPEAAPFALFTQRTIRLEKPVIEYASVLLPDSSSEGAALKGCPDGLWTLALDHDGRSLLINHFKENPDRWIGKPGRLTVPEEDKALVPAGTYTLGESPGYSATLEEFRIGKYEVTNAQLAAFLNEVQKEDPRSIPRLVDMNHGGIKVIFHKGRYVPLKGCGNLPATCITWYGAEQVCKALGGRLPSGDEWEAAARGADARLYPWGNTWNSAKANVWGSEDGYPWLAPVDAFTEGIGPFGAMNQSGNVYEWVDNRQRRTNPNDPTDMGELRGGSWMTLKETARLDYIDGNYFYVANDHNGVRCAWP